MFTPFSCTKHASEVAAVLEKAPCTVPRNHQLPATWYLIFFKRQNETSTATPTSDLLINFKFASQHYAVCPLDLVFFSQSPCIGCVLCTRVAEDGGKPWRYSINSSCHFHAKAGSICFYSRRVTVYDIHLSWILIPRIPLFATLFNVIFKTSIFKENNTNTPQLMRLINQNCQIAFVYCLSGGTNH